MGSQYVAVQMEETVISGTVVSMGKITATFEPKYFRHPREIVINVQFVYKSLFESSFSTHLKHGTLMCSEGIALEQYKPQVCVTKVSQHSIYQFMSLLHPRKLF